MLGKVVLTSLILLALPLAPFTSGLSTVDARHLKNPATHIKGKARKFLQPTYISLNQKRYTPKGIYQNLDPTKYPIHNSIITTFFYVGEPASADNDYIANDQSAWDSQWVKHFGGVDDPTKRNGYLPAGFTPKENPFYFALPYDEFTSVGLKENSILVYWFDPNLPENKSLLKNHWIKITSGGKVAYAQWEDVGPGEDDDINYVFGSARPKNTFGAKAGLDVSPAVKDFFGGKDVFSVSWQFVTDTAVPDGPWKKIVTTSDPSW